MKSYSLAIIFCLITIARLVGPQSEPTESRRPALTGPDLFVDVSEAAGITASHRASWDEYSKDKTAFTDGYMAVGQAWGDYNNDGWVDLYVTGNLDDNVLYRNNRDGTFSVSDLSVKVSQPRATSGGAVWADYDNDGWRDLYIVNYGPNVLFHNERGRGFTDVTDRAGVGDGGKGTSATWGDYDRDGYLDLYVVNWSCYPKCEPLDNAQAGDRLYHNNGDGTFSDVTGLLILEKTQGAGFAASFADYDGDGDGDLYVINDMLKNPIGNVLWRNDGPGCGGWCWTDASVTMGAFFIKHGMGLAVGDYDNDLDLDVYFSDMVNPMVLMQNQGDGLFKDVAKRAGVSVGPSSAVGWGTGFFDYDNDGWLDLFLGTTEFIQDTLVIGPQGMHFPHTSFLFHNNGNSTFTDVTPTSWAVQPKATMGFAYADYDHDGALDFVTGNWNEGYRLYRNAGLAGRGHHWLTLQLTGGGPVNRDAVGARAYISTSDGRTLMQEVVNGSSMGAGNDTALHFGLEQATAEQVAIVWPDGTRQVLDNPPVDQIWSLTYGESPDAAATEVFSDVSRQVGITARHKGVWDMFNPDFSSGYLGIGQAWGDYDNDGWVDLYVTGNQVPSTLYRNNGDGSFNVSDLSAQVSLPDRFTGGAIWADYDNDGWRDLYVVNYGPNVLFHNDGGQGFSDVTAVAGVGDTGKGSGAAWGDYDQDGYLDLYVVNWACYPECKTIDFSLSEDRLYHNNGDGTFKDVSNLLIREKLQGAGFTASFVDFDNDRDLDIYVVNDSLMNPIGNVLWRNDGPGCKGWCWSDASQASGAGVIIEGMGLAVGDYDNDQDLDFYFSNMVNPMALLRNQDGRFADVARKAGVEIGPSSAVGWGTGFFDYDNDGWLDLYLTTTEFVQYVAARPPEGMHFGYPDYLFRNSGDGAFVDATPASWAKNPAPTMGFAYADYDQDGRLDFVVGQWNEGYALYRNTGQAGPENHWLTIRLVGGGPINRDAIGARVYLTTSDGRTQMQDVICGSSLGAGNDTALHFGLGQAAIQQVKVVWPDGTTQVLDQAPVDRVWQVNYSPSVAAANQGFANRTDLLLLIGSGIILLLALAGLLIGLIAWQRIRLIL